MSKETCSGVKRSRTTDLKEGEGYERSFCDTSIPGALDSAPNIPWTNAMKIKYSDEEVTQRHYFIHLGSNRFYESEVWNLMDALECTCMLDYIVIDSEELQDTLEELDVINTSIRGGSWRGERYQEFCDFLITPKKDRPEEF